MDNAPNAVITATSVAAVLVLVATTRPVPGAEVLPEGFPTRRGSLAFFDARLYTEPEANAERLAWFANFDLLVTNNWGLPGDQTRAALQRRGCKLFLYAWTNGFYEHEVGLTLQDGGWRRDLVNDHRDWLLSPDTLPSAMGPPAFYFDLANDDMVEYRCRQLAEYRARTGHDGIFFDYAGEYPLPEEVRDVWRERHTGVPYDGALIGFFRRLREIDPGMIIFTNQAHRSTEPLLAEVAYDMDESQAASYAWGPETMIDGETLNETYFRPWPGEWGIEGLYGKIERRLARWPPRRGFIYLDYMRPLYGRDEDGALTQDLDIEAVYYSYCAAALWGRQAYCSDWFLGTGCDERYDGPLYFADLGRPLGHGPEVLDGFVVREYQRGLVALLTAPEPAAATVELRDCEGAGLYDLLEAKWRPVTDGRARLRLRPSRYGLSPGLRPAGRVYLKAARPNQPG